MDENNLHGRRRSDLWWKRPLSWALIGVVLVNLASWGETLYWRYADMTPAVIHGDFLVLNNDKEVCAGGTLRYLVAVDRKMDVPAKIRRTLANGYVIAFEESAPPSKPLGKQLVPVGLPIPKNIEEGTWTLKWTAVYQIGPEKREISVNAKSEPFRIRHCK